MSTKLAGLSIAVLGGDDRETVLVTELLKMGAKVRVVGLPLKNADNLTVCSNIEEAVEGVKVILLPMPGTDSTGNIRAKYCPKPLKLEIGILESLPRDTVIFVGFARPILKQMTIDAGIKLIEIAELDEIAILNSIPSAEGAIQMAMEEKPITIHGSNSVVIGFGRTGMTLARMLQGLGAKTTVVARKPAHLARIEEIGYSKATYDRLKDVVRDADFIFNTVPAMILDAEVLQYTSPDALIIDLASDPGGTDFGAAEKLGIKAILAPGLPGKVAPKTAGLILAKVLPDLILKEIDPGTGPLEVV